MKKTLEIVGFELILCPQPAYKAGNLLCYAATILRLPNGQQSADVEELDSLVGQDFMGKKIKGIERFCIAKVMVGHVIGIGVENEKLS